MNNTRKSESYRDLFKTPESVDREEHIIATYKIEAEANIELSDIAVQCAFDGSTVEWCHLPYHTDQFRARYTAKVRTINKTSDRTAIIDIAFPLINISPSIGGIPLLFAVIAGSIFRERTIKSIRIIDIQLPLKFCQAYQGPRSGMEGIRKMLGVNDRPLLIARIHDVGMEPEYLAKICYEIARGGADIIYGSPLLIDTGYSPLERRIKLVNERLEKVNKKRKEKTLYFPNLTTNAGTLLETVNKALNLGVAGFELDMLCTGFSMAQEVREKTNALIIFYPITHSLYTRGNSNGIDLSVILKLGRLVGADMACISAMVGRFELPSETELLKDKSILTAEWENFKSTLPIVIGGQHPGTIQSTLKLLGNDIGISAGSGILGHPDGYCAGARAMRQAIDIAINNVLETGTSKYKEYKRAIDEWGIH